LAQPGNDLEITTQIDGATVGVKEAKDYVKGVVKIEDPAAGEYAGKIVQIYALDFTKKGENENIKVKVDGKTAEIKKSALEPTELFEYGVYNSETDTTNNPKTDENKPDVVGAVISRLSERLKEITSSLDELRLFVKDNSSLSHDSLDTCIQELGLYLKGLEEEGKKVTSDTIN
jgi:hypothetical protein